MILHITTEDYLKLNDYNDYNGANEDFTKAIEIDKGFAYAFNNRGFAKYNLGLYKAALKDCNYSLKLKPKNSWAYYYRGLIKLKLDEKKEACEDFSEALELGYEKAVQLIGHHCN